MFIYEYGVQIRDLQSGPDSGGLGPGPKFWFLPGPGLKFSSWFRSFFLYQKLDFAFRYLLYFCDQRFKKQ